MTVILIDGNNCAYRFGWVHRNLASFDGVKTGVAYGLLGLLLRFKRKYPDARFVVVWDGQDRHLGWRNKIYPDYKGNRSGDKPKEMHDAIAQIPLVDQMLQTISIPAIRAKEIEADDVIGILATKCLERDWEPIIYSSDRDYMQLMPAGVRLIRGADKDHRLIYETEADVLEEFRCRSKDVLKVRAIAGDKSDNIPGIKAGIGPVKASQLLAQGFDLTKSDLGMRNFRLMQIVTDVNFPLFSTGARAHLRSQVDIIMDVLETGTRPAGLAEVAEFFSELSMIEAVGSRHEIMELMS